MHITPSFFIYNHSLLGNEEPMPAKLLINRGLYYGDGFFDTQLIDLTNNCIPNWSFHKRRLESSFEVMNMEPIEELIDEKKYRALIKPFIDHYQNQTPSAYFRIQIWRDGTRGYRTSSKKASYLIESDSFSPRNSGLITVALQLVDNLANRPNIAPTLKTSSSVGYVLKLFHNQSEHETLFIDSNNCVLEGETTSIFCFHKGVLSMPATEPSLHHGVSRLIMPHVAKKCGYTFTSKPIKVDELDKNELFILSNSLHGLRAISSINEKLKQVNLAEFSKINQAYDDLSQFYGLQIV